jgi:hypothetical protein
MRLFRRLLLLPLLPALFVSAAEPPSARLVNLATRAAVGGAPGTPISGFVVAGAGAKPVLVRAVGPALAGFGVAGSLADPRLALLADATVLAENDNWLAADASVMGAVGAFALSAGSRDAALVRSLVPRGYTVPVTAPAGASGVALLEVYDAEPAAGAYLVNASTRAFVGTGDNVLIPGFVIAGPGSLRILIRAVGPGLGAFGVAGVLADPTITLYRVGVVVATNDNWGSAANGAEVAATARAFGAFELAAGSRDAALVASLPAGSYSAVVSGVGGGTGTALVEVYAEAPAAAPATAGFTFAEVATQPAIPTFLDATVISARIQAPGGGRPVQATLEYRIGGGALQSLPMWDDGRHEDQLAGDGIFAAAIPAQAAGATVSYAVAAVDAAGGRGVSASGAYLVAATFKDALFTSPEFLGIPTDRGVTVNFEAASTLEAYVEFGASPGEYVARTAAAVYPAGSPAEIRIEAPAGGAPLAAGRRHYYRVRYRAPGEAVFRARGERSFVTQRAPGSGFTFTITADPHLDEVTNPGLFALAMRNIAADTPDFHVDLGDIFMSDKLSTIIPGLTVNYGLVEYRAVTLRNEFAQFAHSVPFFFSLGNHEGEYGYVFAADRSPDLNSNVGSWNLRARKLYFPTPVPGGIYTGSAEKRTILGKEELLENYYAWEWGDALFVVLDPYNNTLANPNATGGDNWRWSLGRAQYDWLRATLARSRARHKFVFLHNLVGGAASGRGGVEAAGRYEWGGRNADDSDGFAEKRPGWGVPIHTLLVQSGVSAVFHGHDHFYGYQQLDGIVYQECPQPGTGNFSTGSARDGGYVAGTILPNSGHLRVTVGPAETKVEYVRAALPTQETASLRNRGVAHTYPIAPKATP